MKAEIKTPVEIVSITQTFPEDKGMVTVLKVAAKLHPGEVARILLMFDLEIKATEIDVSATKGK